MTDTRMITTRRRSGVAHAAALAARPRLRAAGLLLAVAALAGCAAVGPDFQKPTLPAAAGAPDDRYGREPASTTVSADAKDATAPQQLKLGDEVARDWWKAFKSPELDALVDEALKHNPSVDAMLAAVRQAHEAVNAQEGQYYPAISANYQGSRQLTPTGTLSPNLNSGEALYTLHTAQLTVGFVPDVLGLNRRTVESLKAQEENQQLQFEAARITLISNVITTTFQLATLNDQVKATREIIGVNRKILDLLHTQFRAGAASGIDVAAQESALAQAELTLPPLEKQLEQTRDQLAVLVGHLPSQGGTGDFKLTQFTLPATLPLSLPSKLVEQRPDVKAAEAQVHSASAQVGIAVANRLPQFAIAGSLGGTATQISQLFAAGNAFWAVAGSVTQPIYDFGTLKARQKGAEAYLDQSVAEYRSVALTAFQNVADSLYALEQDAKAQVAANKATTAAKKSYDLTKAQLDFGFVNIPTLLAAEQAYLQARVAQVQAEGSRLSDSAALYQALGGGWSQVASN